MENINEIWQAEVNGQIYEASFEELTQWITEGALLPQDKVRRGNLRWIEAQKVPTLYGYFNSMTLGTNEPIVQTTDAQNAAPLQPDFAKLEGINCVLHNEVEAKYYCETCINYFCNNCPKTSGGLSNCCPLCGAICSPLQSPKEEPEVLEVVEIAEDHSNQLEEDSAYQQTAKANYSTGVKTGRIETQPPSSGFGGFMLGMFMALLLAAGGAYLWAYQFAANDEGTEKKITEVVVLEEKYNTEKQGLRLQFANQMVNPAGETLEQAQARLKVKYDGERATLIENYRSNQAFSQFYTFGGIAFAVLFFGLILIKAMSSK